MSSCFKESIGVPVGVKQVPTFAKYESLEGRLCEQPHDLIVTILLVALLML